MSFSLLTLVIFGITAAIIYKETRKGYKHGLSRSLINLATLIFCAVFSSIVSMWIAMGLGTFVMQMFQNMGMFRYLSEETSIFIGVFELLIKMILSVLLFLIVFYLLKGIVLRLVMLVVRIATGKFGRKKKLVKSQPKYTSEEEAFYVKHDKKLGAVVGAVSGFVLAVIVFMPLTGILKSADEIADLVQTMTQSSEMEESKELQLLDKYANDASGNVLYSCGGKAIYNLTARTRMYGYSTSLNKELETFKSIDLVGLQKELQGAQGITKENSHLVETLLDDTRDSLALKIVMSQVLKHAAENWLERLPYLGIERPNIGSYYELDEFFDSLLFVCSTTTVETYDADIRTTLGLIAIFEENSVFFGERNYEGFMKAFVEGDTLKRIEDELYKNPHMNTVNLAIDDLIMNVLATELLDDSRYTFEQKAIFYKELAAIMSDSQGLDGSVQLVAIANGISDSFDSLGMYLPDSLETRMANIFTANLPSNEQISEEHIEDLFAKYGIAS